MNILDLIDDPQVLIGLAPEELAYQLLQVGQSNLQNGIVHRNVIISTDSPVGQPQRLQRNQQQEVEVALIEALHWLEVGVAGAVYRGAGGVGPHFAGVFVVATAIDGFSVPPDHVAAMILFALSRSISLPCCSAAPWRCCPSMPATSISDRVWIALARGDLSDAVFIAFRAVEEAVRAKGGFAETDIGVDLMRRAFNPDNGPLTNQQQNRPEREALSHLFAGAIGSYKNPHSHRTITISDSSEAQEMVLLASHLLRIVDSR